jgi:hypothetical protein
MTPTCVAIGLSALDAATALAAEGRRQTTATPVVSPPPPMPPSFKTKGATSNVAPPPPTSRPSISGFEGQDDACSEDHELPPPPSFSPRVPAARLCLSECVPDSSAQCQNTWVAANSLMSWDMFYGDSSINESLWPQEWLLCPGAAAWEGEPAAT